MCEKAKGYLATVREYSREIIMFLGFALFAIVYVDFRTFIHDSMEQQAKTAEILSNIEVRISHLENEHTRALEASKK